MDGIGVAAIIVAIGTSVAAIVTSVRAGRLVTNEVVPALADTHHMVRQIDAAVNGKAPGAAPMVDQVQDLHDQIPTPEVPEPHDALLPLVRMLVADMQDRQKRTGAHE